MYISSSKHHSITIPNDPVLYVIQLGETACDIRCEKPKCEVRCSRKNCGNGGCPLCENVCLPAKCQTVCTPAVPNCRV